jgi:predicted amidohydrolase
MTAPPGRVPTGPALPLAARAALWYHAQPLHVDLALAGRRYPRARTPQGETLTVGLCQTRFALLGRAADFAGRMYRFVRMAVQKGAAFVVFPEYTGAMLLGLLPGLSRYGAAPSLQAAAEQLGVDLGDVFRVAAPAAAAIYRNTFASLAQRFGVTIVAGTIVLPGEDGQLRNTAHLFGPNGALLGTQDKLHLTALEEGWLAPGRELKIFKLPYATVALPVCMDFTYWETTRLAWLQEVDLLVDPAADDRGDLEALAARGVRTRVQEVPAYGLHAFMLADLFNLHWRGRSSVYAPAALLPAGQSNLGEAAGDDQEEVVVAMLDLGALRRHRQENPPEFNLALVTRYLPGLYQSYQAAAPAGRQVG